MTRALLCALALLAAVPATAQTVPPCAPGPRDASTYPLRPAADNPLPVYPPLLAQAEMEDVVRLRMRVSNGRVEPESVCVLEAGNDWTSRAAATAVAAWRFDGPVTPPSPYETEFRFSAADTLRASPGRAATLGEAPTAPASGRIPVVIVPVRDVRHGFIVARPADALPRATRDSAELAILRALPARDSVSAGCVEPAPSAWMRGELPPGRGTCETPEGARSVLVLRWGSPETGWSADGALLLQVERQLRDWRASTNVRYGSTVSTLRTCVAARMDREWRAECSDTGRMERAYY